MNRQVDIKLKNPADGTVLIEVPGLPVPNSTATRILRFIAQEIAPYCPPETWIVRVGFNATAILSYADEQMPGFVDGVKERLGTGRQEAAGNLRVVSGANRQDEEVVFLVVEEDPEENDRRE